MRVPNAVSSRLTLTVFFDQHELLVDDEIAEGHILHYISVISEALADIFLIFQNAQRKRTLNH